MSLLASSYSEYSENGLQQYQVQQDPNQRSYNVQRGYYRGAQPQYLAQREPTFSLPSSLEEYRKLFKPLVIRWVNFNEDSFGTLTGALQHWEAGKVKQFLQSFKESTTPLTEKAINEACAACFSQFTEQNVLREEVPFERWFFDFETSDQVVKPRLWAVVYLAESAIRGALVGAAWCASKVFNCAISSQQYGEVFSALKKSASLSFKAMISHSWAVKGAHYNPSTLAIGCSPKDQTWGTAYAGKCQTSTWDMLRNQYRWSHV